VERVRERGGQDLGQDFPRELPLPCVQPHKTRIIRERERERCQQGREKGGRISLPLGRFAKREREEKRREEEEIVGLAEIPLKFEKCKI
jgi:hypothetical protein